jgi:hypothetical protein
MASLEEKFKLAEFMAKPTTQGGMSYADRPNPYGLRSFPTEAGYGGEMMPKTSGWAGEIPTLTGEKMTEMSLGGEKGQPFIPMIYEGITPEEIEVVRDYEAGLREDNDPLVIAVKSKAQEAAMKRMHMHKSPFKDLTPHLAEGGQPTSFVDPSSPLSVGFDEWLKGDAPLARIMRGEGNKIIEDLKKPAKPITPEEMTDLAMNIGPGALGTIEGKLTKELGKRAAKYTKKGAIQADLRHMPYEDALDLAKKGVHLKQDPSGQFVGAPRGITSLRDINKLRQNYDDMVEGGILGGDWYERAQKFHKEFTPSEEAATELSRANALFSAMADPTSNLGFTLQAHNAFEAGAPQMKVRTGPMASRYKKAIEEGKPIPLGQKTEVYAKYIDPSQGIGSTGVNDFRHARNFGYTQIDKKTGEAVPITRGLSPQEHAWLDAETILATERANKKGLSGRTDWNPEEIQAAPWVLQKAQALMSKSPKRFPTIESAMAEANKTYLEGSPKYQAYSTYEQIPYSTSGHLTGMENIPNEAKLNYSSEANWLDQEGKDILSQKIGSRHGMLTGKTESGQGVYLNPKTGITETNPQYQARSLIGVSQDPELGPIVQPQSAKLMDAMNAIRGFVDVQGASPWIKSFTPKKIEDATSIHLKLTHPITSDEMIKLNEVAQKNGFQGVTDLAHDGVIIGFNDNIKNGRQLKKLLDSSLSKDIKSIMPEKVTDIKRIRTEGGYPSYEDVFGAHNEGTGKATKQLLDYISQAQEGSPDVVARLMKHDPLIAEKLTQMNLRDIEAQSKYGVGAPRKDVLNARDIVSKYGLSGLKGALDRGEYLPAALAIPFATEDENKQ